MKKSYFKRKLTVPLKKTKIKVVGHSTVSEQKEEIQHLLRLNVVYRDGGCILRNIRHCDSVAFVEERKVISNVTIQADHLITRANSATYADLRLVVCICSGCHFWKKYNEKQYDVLVKTIISKERVKLWDICLISSWKPVRTSTYDWKIAIVVLNNELKQYEQKQN